MKLLKEIILFLVICNVYNYSIAQPFRTAAPENYRVVTWNVDEGFPHKRTNSLLKDSNGFLWIGAETGLSRFDGNSFKNYFPGKNSRRPIPSGNIKGLKEDSLHNIWIGSDNGIWRYDNYTDTFAHFLPGDISAAANTYIIPFWATGDELLCVEGDSMITAYNIHDLKKRRVTWLSKKIRDNDGVQFSVCESNGKDVWMLLNADGFFHVSLETGKMDLYLHGGTEGMCYDKKRNAIWLNAGEGLLRFNIPKRQFQLIDDVNKFHDRGVAINIDRYDRIWVCTFKGMYIYDPDQRSVVPLFSKDSILRETISWANYRMYCDKEGLVWVVYYTQAGKGMTQLIPSSPTALRYTNENGRTTEENIAYLNSFVRSNDYLLQVGHDHKLKIYDPATGLLRQIDPKALPVIDQSKRISFLGVDSTLHKAWLCASGPDQIYELDIVTQQCKPVVIKDLNSQVLPNILIDDMFIKKFRNGLIFFAGIPGQSSWNVFQVCEDSSICRQLLQFENVRLTDLGTNGEDKLFLRVDGSPVNKSFSLIQGKWTQVTTPLDSIPWIAVTYNKADSSWWAGAFMKLVHYDMNFRVIRTYTQDDGVTDLRIHSIMPDNLGNIWFNGSSDHISRLNLSSGIITTLSENDGFQKQPYYPISVVGKDRSGDIFFGGYHGVDRVKPDNYVFVPSGIYLKSLEIKEFGLPVSVGINNLKQLSLKYFQNRINIETGTIDYYSRGKSHIRYKLEGEGRNDDWQYAPANHTIRYEELPPGKYTVLIQAGNAGNEFSGPVKSLIFEISPAFWNTWWFRILGALAVLTLIYAIIRWRLQQRFHLQIERSQKEKQLSDLGQKTAELQQQKTEMEMQALRAQMNPHFIFNSLNSINRFILQNNKLQASEYLTKFSKLVRMILQNSQASLITLESELESLSLYLEMEALRFNYHFDYKISIPNEIDVEVLKVPPLILQPYVENAIWHGLMHKEEKGQLDIEISEENNCLYFKITDNGIGRKQAAALSSKSATRHKSMGLRITAHRIAMMQHSNSTDSPVTINDLVEPDGTAAGTEVIIKMPVIE